MRILLFTDIHFGARNNSEQHLDDCDRYIDWLCARAVELRVDAIAFLGDWYESRSAVNIRTLKSSHVAARKLNALGVPVFFLVGNHDLFYRASRGVYSTDPFADLPNFVVVAEPTQLTDELFAAPYLFSDEYPELAGQINASPYVLGHFEFRGFVVTGHDRRMEHGPDAEAFAGPRRILTGHFHKRQLHKNVAYIGNTFPTNYGDAWDTERGCALLDTATNQLDFLDWPDAPAFYKTKMSSIVAGDTPFKAGGRVWCTLDVALPYSEVQAIRERLTAEYELREFTVEEDRAAQKEVLEGEEAEDDADVDLSDLSGAVRQMLREDLPAGTTLDPEYLVQLYDEIPNA